MRVAQLIAFLNEATTGPRKTRRRTPFSNKSKRYAAAATALVLCSTMILPGVAFAQVARKAPVATTPAPALPQKGAPPVSGRPVPAPAPPMRGGVGAIYHPTYQPVMYFGSVNVRQIEQQEKLEPAEEAPAEIKSINPPKGDPPAHAGRPIMLPTGATTIGEPEAPPSSATGVSPGPTQTFKGSESLVAVIPPDTDGAVGTTHIVTASNDRFRIHDRNGAILSTVTTNSFWSGVVLEGGATPSITDPRIQYDRFNQRWIFSLVANPQALSSATLIAVSATNDPTGTWFRYGIDCDPTATAGGGKWADFPSMGFNKNWIVIQNNLFGYGSLGTGYQGPQILVIDKAAIYAGPGSITPVATFFEATGTGCVGPVFETQLGCGFTMAPAVSEDNTSTTVYMAEDWDSTAAQLRLSKITGAVGSPVLTVGTQIPQSPNSWRFNATRIGTTGGYVPQRDTSTYTVNTTARMMANDSRLGTAPVFRNGSLWCAHHVMLPTVPTPAGTQVGGGGTNPADNHTAIQWWQIDPTIEALPDPITGLGTTPLQRARIEDPTADNCHNGANALVATPPCNSSAANQHGTFFVFPSISVNQNNDALIGFSQFSAFHYGSAAYAFRSNADPLNTTRDPVVFHAGQSRDNLGGGSGAARQNRWGDYSATQTDPLNDTDFWTTQEYTGVYRDFGIGVACPWETWWALVKPGGPVPSKSGSLIISEFRLRGPQGVRDEFVELYNPSNSPTMVNTTDNSDGWALATQTTAGTVSGVTVIPNGTVIPPRGHFLIADNPTAAADAATVYSLGSYPSSSLRAAESDTGFHVDIPDTNGIAIFKTANPANFSAGTVMDAAGPSTLPPGSIFKEGAGFGILPSSGTLQYTMVRTEDQVLGTPNDTNNNAADFVFADTAGTSTGAGQRIGAPGPENVHSPIQRYATLLGFQLDQSVGSSMSPNRARDLTSDPPNNSTFGTITLRRRITNNTGGPVTRLRFRIINITTFPPAAGVADLRARTSSDTPNVLVNDAATCSSTGGIPPTPPCLVTVRGTTLETPPAQTSGGGLNSTLSAGTITLATPLAAGASINVQFLLGVQQTGYFQFYVFIEDLP